MMRYFSRRAMRIAHAHAEHERNLEVCAVKRA